MSNGVWSPRKDGLDGFIKRAIIAECCKSQTTKKNVIRYMAARRYYYSDSITDFLSRSNNEIVGALTLASQHDVNDEMLKSWVENRTLGQVPVPN